MNTLKAEKRSMDIKAKKLRREGYVTGNVFGREMEESVPLKIEKTELARVLKENHKGSQVMLEVEGKQYDVLIKDIQFNTLKKQIDEIDFQALVSTEKVHSTAAVQIENREKVLEGALQECLEEIEYKALPAALVDHVTVDVAGMKVGDVIRVKDLEISKNPDVDIHTDPEAIVVMVDAIRNSIPEDEEADEEAAEE